MLTLRDYQEKGIALLRSSFLRGHRRIIFWMATGGGKTACFISIAESLFKNKKKVLVVMRRRELIFQTQESIKKFTGIDASIIMGNEKGFDPNCNIQVCSIDTISRRIDKDHMKFLLDYDYVIVDEVHDATSPKYCNFLDKFADKLWIGFTASPYNTGTKYLVDWEDLISPITAAELRDQGYLVPERTYAPKKIDTSGIKTRAGDFDQKALAERAMESKIVGDSVECWKQFGENRPTLGFGVNIEHSKLLAEAFRQHGIPSAHIDQSHNKQERANAIKQLKNGSIKILFSVNVFSTGTDIPVVGCGLFARPTKSEILYVQQVGRVLRPYKQCASCKTDLGADPKCYRCDSTSFVNHKSDAIVIDQANNCERFGLAYDPRYPRIRPTIKKKRKVLDPELDIKTRTCEACYAVYPSELTECPVCEHTNESVKRNIKTEEGELELKASKDLRYNKMIKIKNDLMKFSVPGWKPGAKWLKLYEKHGEEIFEFKKELEMPGWVRRVINKTIIAKEAQSYISTL